MGTGAVSGAVSGGASRTVSRSARSATNRLPDRLEHELARPGVVRNRHRIVAIEAGETEALSRQVDRPQHALDREIRERVGANELADALEVHARSDQLGLDLGVDAVEA